MKEATRISNRPFRYTVAQSRENHPEKFYFLLSFGNPPLPSSFSCVIVKKKTEQPAAFQWTVSVPQRSLFVPVLGSLCDGPSRLSSKTSEVFELERLEDTESAMMP